MVCIKSTKTAKVFCLHSFHCLWYLPLESEGQSDDGLSGAIIGGIIGGAIGGVIVFIFIIALLFIWTMCFRKHSRQTKGVHSILRTIVFL